MPQEIVVIKVGTGVLTCESDGTLDEASLVRLVTSVSELVASGIPCVMVSSGAVGAGVSALKLDGYLSTVLTVLTVAQSQGPQFTHWKIRRCAL